MCGQHEASATPWEHVSSSVRLNSACRAVMASSRGLELRALAHSKDIVVLGVGGDKRTAGGHDDDRWALGARRGLPSGSYRGLLGGGLFGGELLDGLVHMRGCKSQLGSLSLELQQLVLAHALVRGGQVLAHAKARIAQPERVDYHRALLLAVALGRELGKHRVATAQPTLPAAGHHARTAVLRGLDPHHLWGGQRRSIRLPSQAALTHEFTDLPWVYGLWMVDEVGVGLATGAGVTPPPALAAAL